MKQSTPSVLPIKTIFATEKNLSSITAKQQKASNKKISRMFLFFQMVKNKSKKDCLIWKKTFVKIKQDAELRINNTKLKYAMAIVITPQLCLLNSLIQISQNILPQTGITLDHPQWAVGRNFSWGQEESSSPRGTPASPVQDPAVLGSSSWRKRRKFY